MPSFILSNIIETFFLNQMQHSKLNYERKLFLDFSIDCIFSKKEKTKQKRIEMKETVKQKTKQETLTLSKITLSKITLSKNHKDDQKISGG
jgi:hypothetical protein